LCGGIEETFLEGGDSCPRPHARGCACFKLMCLSTSHLEEGVKLMLIRPVDIDLLRQLKVGLKTTARTDVFQTVENFCTIITGFVL